MLSGYITDLEGNKIFHAAYSNYFVTPLSNTEFLGIQYSKVGIVTYFVSSDGFRFDTIDFQFIESIPNLVKYTCVERFIGVPDLLMPLVIEKLSSLKIEILGKISGT